MRLPAANISTGQAVAAALAWRALAYLTLFKYIIEKLEAS